MRVDTRVASAHKTGDHLLDMVETYNKYKGQLVFITFASGWFALLFGALDLPAHTAKPLILLATGAAGMTVGGRIVQANWKNRRH